MPPKPKAAPAATGRTTRAKSKQACSEPKIADKLAVNDDVARLGEPAVEITPVVDVPKKQRSSKVKASVAKDTMSSGTKAQKRAHADESTTLESKKQTSKKHIQDLEGQLQDQWERMEAADDEVVAQQEAATIRRLSAITMPREFQRGEESDDSCEFIDVGDVSTSSESSDDTEDKKMAELQAQINELRSKKKGRKERANPRLLPLASGLKAGFSLARKITSKQGIEVREAGLNDEDVEDECPDKFMVSAGVRMAKTGCRVNMDVRSSETSAPLPRPRATNQPPIGKPMPTKSTQPLPAVQRPTQSKARRVSNTRESAAHPKHVPKPTSQQHHDQSESKSLTARSVRIEHMPAFSMRNQKWRLSFIPTLNRRFYNSTEPFDEFLLSSDSLVTIVQDIVDAVYIDVTYTVKCKGEPFHLMAYNRVNERRNTIATDALDLVIAKVKSFQSPREAKQWLRWARRMNGPLFWETPTPESCKITDTGDEDYIAPSGRLKSEFILGLASSALKHSSNALEEYNAAPPVGLFATIMAALERAVMIVDEYGDKSKTAAPFSKTSWGAQVKQYVSNLEGVDRQKWAEILGACGDLGSEGDHGADISDKEDMGHRVVDLDRHNIFAFQSPVKR